MLGVKIQSDKLSVRYRSTLFAGMTRVNTSSPGQMTPFWSSATRIIKR